MSYTMRRTAPDDPARPDDFIFRHCGIDRGRCYLERTPMGWRWRWTIYMGLGGPPAVPGVPIAGDADNLDGAKRAFQSSFDAMLAPPTAAGVACRF